MEFGTIWDTVELLYSIQTLLVLIGIVVSVIWGLSMIGWEAKNKPLKKRLILATIVPAIWGVLLLIVSLRISALEDIKSAEFEKKINKAQDDASLLQTKSDSLNYRLNLFRSVLTESESIRIVSEHQLKQQLKLTNEELEQTKEKYAPRSLTNEQEKEFLNYLSIYPKGVIKLQCIMDDKESYNFAKYLESLFKKAGFEVGYLNQASFINRPVGIKLIIHSRTTAPSITSTIQKAFYLIGIDAPAFEEDSQKPNTLMIRVGYKP